MRIHLDKVDEIFDNDDEDDNNSINRDLLNLGIRAEISKNRSNVFDYQAENNIFSFDGILENSITIRTEDLSVPNLEKNTDLQAQIRDQNFARKFTEFYEKLKSIFEEFSDFKVLNVEFNNFDLFFKLIAKEIIFIIKVPSSVHIQNLMSKKT